MFTSRIESLLNPTPFCTLVSKNVASVSEISAVNLIVGWKLFTFKKIILFRFCSCPMLI